MYLEKLENIFLDYTDSGQKEIECIPVNEFDMSMAIFEHEYNIKGNLLTPDKVKDKIHTLKSGKENFYYRGIRIKIIEA